MAQVIVSALYLWLAFTAVALVVWIVKRMRANRRAAQARQARTVDSLLIGDGATTNARKTIDVSDTADKQVGDAAARAERTGPSVPAVAAMATAGAPVKEKAEARAESERATKSLGSVIASSVGAPPPRTTPDPAPPEIVNADPEPEPEPQTEAEPAADDRRDAAPPTSTIAELLSGIRLPVDLRPEPPADAALASTALMFTSDADPAVVGSAFADELERLGYEIYSLSDTDAVARRGEADSEMLSMSIRVTDPGLAIDVWVGAGESPLSEG